MANEEQRVRDAARDFNDAVVAARAAGYIVDWPASSDGLATISISAGRLALTPEEIGQAAKAQAEREQASLIAAKPVPEIASAPSVNSPTRIPTPIPENKPVI
jgi:hypothetical protein